MEIADVISCDFYIANDWDRREESEFRISRNGEQIGLEIENRELDQSGSLQAVTRLKLTRMELRTLERIQSCLGEWLRQSGAEETRMKTSPVEGICEGNSTENEVYRLEVELTEAGLRLVALAGANQPTASSVRIPSTNMAHDEMFDNYNHLRRLYSLIEVFLAGIESDGGDIIHSMRYRLNPEEHLHPDLQSVCLGRLDDGDYSGAIQAAGKALEESLQSKVPDEIVDSARNANDLANRAFRENDPVFRWGYNNGEQKGLMFLYSGAFLALRNPMSHPRGDPDRNRYLDDVNEQDALDALCLFNFLLRKLDTYGCMDLEQE
jgi:hypothetical protein